MKNICPISSEKIDENILRINSFFVLIIILLGFFTSYYLFLFLFIDFLLRAFSKKKTPSFLLCNIIVKKNFTIKEKMIDIAPKKFAAGLGTFFSITIFLLYIFLEDNKSSLLESIKDIIILIFFVAVFLETFFAFCLGCKIYSFLQFLKKNN